MWYEICHEDVMQHHIERTTRSADDLNIYEGKGTENLDPVKNLSRLLAKPEIIEISAAIHHFQDGRYEDDSVGHANCEVCSLVRDINHWLYYGRTKIANSGGKHYLWILKLDEARMVLQQYRLGSPANRLIEAAKSIEEILEAYDRATQPTVMA